MYICQIERHAVLNKIFLQHENAWHDVSKGLFIWKPGWPVWRDSPVSEISSCYCFSNNSYRAFIWDKRTGPVGEISLERGEISLAGMKIFHINTHNRAGPVAGMKVISKSCQIW